MLRRLRRCHEITCVLKWFRWLGCRQLPFYVFYLDHLAFRTIGNLWTEGLFLFLIVPRSCVYSHTTMFADMFKSPKISRTASRYNDAAINSLQNWQLWAIPLNRAQTQLSGNRIPTSNGTSQHDKRERSYTPPLPPPRSCRRENCSQTFKHIH